MPAVKEFWVTGIWKFSDKKVSLKKLLDLAEEWEKDSDILRKHGEYLEIYVRKVSKDQHGIGFVLAPFTVDDPLDNSPQEKEKLGRRRYNDYFEEMTDTLKKLFGNGFVGWDISYPTYIVKGVL